MCTLGSNPAEEEEGRVRKQHVCLFVEWHYRGRWNRGEAKEHHLILLLAAVVHSIGESSRTFMPCAHPSQ